MRTQIKHLTRVELCSLFGWNTFRFSKDPRAKRRFLLLAAVWAILMLILFAYVGGLVLSFIQLGLSEIVPTYLITISSLILFFFGIFKAGSLIFRQNGYDILCSLPVSQASIVASRFLRLYAEDLLLALAVMLPGMAVYGWMLRPQASFYLTGVLSILSLPLLPIAAATLLGALITGISSRLKHKSLASTGLSILLVMGIFLLSSRLSALEGQITPEMLQNLAAVCTALLEKLYPPAAWLGSAVVHGSILQALGFALGSATAFALVAAIVACGFHTICRQLYGTTAKHDYRMGSLNRSSVLLALYRRELRRYFSSSVYVTNTIIGPIMAVALTAALFFTGTDSLQQAIPLPFDIQRILPFLLGGVFCLMTTTAVSLSMEGKEWWIVKSLPLDTRTILNSKLLLSLSLALPFYLTAELLMLLALRPGAVDALWLLAIPAVIILFSCVFGITINLRFPVFSWESEVTVVKQSASSLIGGMGGSLVALFCAAPAALLPSQLSFWWPPIVCVLLLAVTAILYRRNNAAALHEL